MKNQIHSESTFQLVPFCGIMGNNYKTLNKQYEIISYICNQLMHFQSDFENKFFVKNDDDKETFESIKELFKTLQNDAFASADLLFEILDGKEGNQ